MEPIIINNFLPNFYYKVIFDTVCSPDFTWKFLQSSSGWKDIQYADDIKISERQEGLAHLLVGEDHGVLHTSEYHNLFIPVYSAMEESFNFKITEILRTRLGRTVNIGTSGYANPHVDFTFPHLTMLWYLNDSDGDTVIYNEKFSEENNNKLTVKMKNTPKKNQALLFNGLHFHSSGIPSKSLDRIVLNVNFFIE